MTLFEEATSRGRPAFFNYNADVDMLMFLIVAPTEEFIAHYLDEHVALLYLAKSNEVVGLQVEAFEKSFLPRYSSLQKAWRLSDACDELEDMGDLAIVIQQKEPEVAQEVIRIAQGILGYSPNNLHAVPA
ncbi:MAG: hypothetical protein P1P76_02465 [Anaerolineales bacterium]|nr:hypothetical protein [Anaerolineales bacterium]